MAQDINLLPSQTAEVTPKVRQQKMLTTVSVVVLIITIVAVGGLFAGKLALQASLTSIDNSINTETQKVQTYKEAEGVYRALDTKLTSLSNFFATQKHYSTFLTQFSQTVPASMQLTDMSVDASDIATISGTVTTYADLAGFYDKLRTQGATSDNEESPYFTKPALVMIGRDDQSSTIAFTVTFSLTPQSLAALPSATPTPTPTPTGDQS